MGYGSCLPTKSPVLVTQEVFVLVCQVVTAEGIETEPAFASAEEVVADVLNQRPL